MHLSLSILSGTIVVLYIFWMMLYGWPCFNFFQSDGLRAKSCLTFRRTRETVSSSARVGLQAFPLQCQPYLRWCEWNHQSNDQNIKEFFYLSYSKYSIISILFMDTNNPLIYDFLAVQDTALLITVILITYVTQFVDSSWKLN